MSNSVYKAIAQSGGSYLGLTLLAPEAAATPVAPLNLSLATTMAIVSFAGALSRNTLARYSTNLIGLESAAAAEFAGTALLPTGYLYLAGGYPLMNSAVAGGISYGSSLAAGAVYTRFVDPLVAGGYLPSVINV